MKVAIFVMLGAGICGLWVATLAWVYGYGVKMAAKQQLHKYGIHKEMLPLYKRAVRIINRLAQLTDLDGVMAGDQLSPVTRQLVTDWVADYKKEIEKP